MKKLRIYNIEIPVGAGDKSFYRAVLRRLGVDRQKVGTITMVSRAVDARKNKPQWNVTADVEVLPKFEEELAKKLDGFRNVADAPETPALEFPIGNESLPGGRPIIIGSGPGGLFAGWLLAKQGYKPLIVERGAPADERLRQIGKFNSGNAELDTESNTLFGEGGAGTFSDGKLYTRKNKDPHLPNVLKLLVEHGAPEEILVDAAPHVGTDKLAPVVVKMREAFEAMGGEIRFRAKFEGIEIRDGAVKAIRVNGESIECGVLLLAIGHSARDTYSMLNDAGVDMEAKPFQLGVRIEHEQSFIDQTQFGYHAGDPELGAAEYFLRCSQNPSLLEVHSFCMCPGGMIVPSVQENGELCTNGMSFSLRNMKYANSGLVSTFFPVDFGGDRHPLAGLRFQKHYEELAFKAGGGDFMCPAQPAADFLTGLEIRKPLEGSYPRGRKYTKLETILPEKFVPSLKYALQRFDKSMPGFADANAVIHAIESRGSSPVRISRSDETRESSNVAGLYPVGEGAGFAGGIVSAALDGIYSAAAVMAKYKAE